MRRVTLPPSRLAFDAGAAIDDLVGPAGQLKRRRPAGSRATVERLVADVAERAKLGRPLRSARELVALYAWLHAEVYGVPAGELRGDAWVHACGAAKRMLRAEFGGDVAAAVEFLRWVWRREREREQYRRERGVDGGRIGWVLQFAKSSLVTDYRVARSRALG